MSGLKRFFALGQENSIFKFVIDTTKIVSGATNGSQNPLTYKIPIIYDSSNPTNCIIQVSDGRADIAISNNSTDINSKSILTFSTAGIYTITIIGRVGFYQQGNATIGYDWRKLISIDNWGYQVKYQSNCFDGCTNLIIKATNPLKLPANSNTFFRNIAGFESGRLDNLIMTDVNSAISILNGVATSFTSLLNSFMPALTSTNGLYSGLTVSLVSKIEIIGNLINDCGNTFGTPLRNFTGELILQTPNNTNIQALCYYFNVSPSLAKVDIRSVTNALNFIRNPMTLARTNATLIGWANDYDWSGVPTVANKVTLDFKGSTYNSSASAAKSFLESKGYVFTNLTLV